MSFCFAIRYRFLPFWINENKTHASFFLVWISLGSHWRLGCVIIFTISIFRHGLAYVSRWLITQLEKRSKMFNNKWQNTPKKGMPCKHQWAFYKPVDINHRHGTHPGHYRLAMLAFWKLSTPSKLCQFRNCGNFAYCLENSLIDTCRLERSYYETDVNWKKDSAILRRSIAITSSLEQFAALSSIVNEFVLTVIKWYELHVD